jgi:hypothetical protein
VCLEEDRLAKIESMKNSSESLPAPPVLKPGDKPVHVSSLSVSQQPKFKKNNGRVTETKKPRPDNRRCLRCGQKGHIIAQCYDEEENLAGKQMDIRGKQRESRC